MNIKQALQQAQQRLNRARLNNSSLGAAVDAQVLLTSILQCNTAHLAAWPEKNLSKEQESRFQTLVKQRKEGQPVAYLVGQREFWSLEFSVNNSTLIPRPETETLVDYILTTFSSDTNIKLLDMGTGTGAIAISIASERPGWLIVASDISQSALKLARQNSNRHHTDHITFKKSNWFENLTADKFNIIVSNPPYIACDDPHLRQGDVRFEPHSALISGPTGMDDIEHLCAQAKNHLINNGCLIIEHGYNQKKQVADCFAKNGFTEIFQQQDLSGQPRMTTGRITNTSPTA